MELNTDIAKAKIYSERNDFIIGLHIVLPVKSKLKQFMIPDDIKEILKNAQNVITIELLAAAQGVDFRDPSKLGKGTKVAYDQVRSVVEKWVDDREMYKDMNLVYNLVQGHDIINAVEATVGNLSIQKQ